MQISGFLDSIDSIIQMNFLNVFTNLIGTKQNWFYWPTDSILRDSIKWRTLHKDLKTLRIYSLII